MSDRPLHSPGFFGTYPSAVIPGLHVIEGGQTSTGSIVNWLRGSVVGQQAWPGFDALNAAAAQLPPGCEGLLCCDHFQVCCDPHTFALRACLCTVAAVQLQWGGGLCGGVHACVPRATHTPPVSRAYCW